MANIQLTQKPRQVAHVNGDFIFVESSTYRSSFSEPADSMDLTVLDRNSQFIQNVAKNDSIAVWQGYIERDQALDRLDVALLTKVFSGRISTSPKLSLSASGRKVTLKCLDRFDELVRGEAITQNYENVLASDVVADVASRVGLGQDITPTTTRHEQLAVANKLPADVVADLAGQEGYEYLVDVQGNLVFRPARTQAERFVFTWGKDLISANIEEISAQVYTHVVVSSFNPATKEEITGAALASDEVLEEYGDVGLKVVDHSARTQADCRSRAQALLSGFLRQNFRAKVSTVGIPSLRKGDGIRLAGVAPYEGVYFIDEIETRYSSGGYLSNITASTALGVIA